MKSPLFWIILAFALLLRVYFAFFVPTDHYTFDGQQYRAIADAILNREAFSSFANGYPLIIAPFRMAFGLDAETPLLVLNVLMSVLTVALTYQIGVIMTGSARLGYGIAFAMAIFPHALRYVQLLMTETCATFLLVLGIWMILYARSGVSARESDESKSNVGGLGFAAGIILGCASSVRPTFGMVAPLLVLIGLLLRDNRRLLGGIAIGTVLCFLFFAGLDLIKVTRTPQTFANNALIAISGDSNNIDFIQFTPEEQKRGASAYFSFALKQPGTFLRQRAISLWELWGFWSLPGNKAENKTVAVRAVVACRFVLFALSCVAIVRARRDFRAWALFAPVLILTVVHAATFSNHRFVAPVEPMLFVLSGMALRGFFAKKPPKLVLETA